MADADVPWQQRFANFQPALDQLEGFFEPPALNEREQQGLIQDRNLTSHSYRRVTADPTLTSPWWVISSAIPIASR